MYVATINVPGYLPMDDDPPTFEDAKSAWEYLAEERQRGEEDAYDLTDGDAADTAGDSHRIEAQDGVGSIWLPTPGYDGDHDLGLAYSVALIECECAYEPGDSGHEFHCPLRMVG